MSLLDIDRWLGAFGLLDSSDNRINPATEEKQDAILAAIEGSGTNVSTANSTTTLLTSGSTFTGTWEDATLYDSIVVSPKTDQDGTYTVQFSPDGVNADSSLTRYYRTSQIEPPHRFTIARQYVRVTFTNTSASDQTYLRLQTILGSKTQLNVPLDSGLSQDYDAFATRPTDYHYEVGLGRRQGQTTWNKWGYNPDVDIGTETVWSVGGTFARMTSADTLNVVSTSTNDDGDPAGTGAQSIIIYGVDSNYEAQTEVVTLNGTTAVTTSNTWLGVNRAAIYLAGSGGINAGDINITVTTGGATQAQIPTGEGSTQHAFFFTQRKHTALMDWLLINVVKTSGGGKPIITIKVWVRSLVSGARYEVFRQNIDVALDNTIQLTPSQPFVVGEKSLIEVEATSDTNNAAVSARFSLIEVRDVDY